MDSSNLHSQFKVEEQYAKYTSMVTQIGHQISTADEWKHDLFPSIGGRYNRNPVDPIPKSRELWTWPLMRTSVNEGSFYQQSANEFLLANTKDDMPGSFPKLSEVMYCNSSAEDPYLVSKKHYPQSTDQNLGGNIRHKNFSIANNMTEGQLSSRNLYTNANDHSPCLGTAAASRYDFNHIFPSTNIATNDMCSTLISNSLDLNLKSLDLFNSTYDSGSCNQSLVENPGKLSRNVLMGHDPRRESNDSPSTTSKVSTFVSGSTTSAKRPGCFSETKESHTEAKKRRSSKSRSLCPTLKVRKEKLGDRVAALQKLTAPFGKTDTASVLTEAIGYIQFLHDQVETLSVPFMKSSQSKLYRTMQTRLKEQGKEEQTPDLRSRGLCLVPQSCAEYFVNRCFNGI
ncbi:Sec14p-like phosphatidylinositol transfer family protein [Hibiscus syriacus]|uniref:Sec14p-like phosphatidylinositol transfer family protein n=1 Tax=Hibiscus syriacus TaxID=106335 RepID=A0A6A3B019_HIBSY|nr:transcription factor bHLH110-like [Hibiscus syriacus]KAE8709513.1 Sec14p-like phosphatidylinositol transfer family protein [Hibiscus syriacus]